MSDLHALVQKLAEAHAANPPIKTATMERYWLDEGRWKWMGTMNGFTLYHVTGDPDLRPELHPVHGQHAYGIQMVSQDGEVLDTRTRAYGL